MIAASLATWTSVAAIAGLPATAWLMIVAAGGLGLGVELAFYFRQRGRWSGSRNDAQDTSDRASGS